MVERPRLHDPVSSTLDAIEAEHNYHSRQQAIRHALREAGYNV